MNTFLAIIIFLAPAYGVVVDPALGTYLPGERIDLISCHCGKYNPGGRYLEERVSRSIVSDAYGTFYTNTLVPGYYYGEPESADAEISAHVFKTSDNCSMRIFK